MLKFKVSLQFDVKKDVFFIANFWIQDLALRGHFFKYMYTNCRAKKFGVCPEQVSPPPPRNNKTSIYIFSFRMKYEPDFDFFKVILHQFYLK